MTELESRIGLGNRVVDKMSGFEGVVSTVSEHLSGCSRIEVTAQGNGSQRTKEWFYEGQLELDGGGKTFDEEPVTETDIDLGDLVRDEVTGFKGIAVVVYFEPYNCPSVGVQPTCGGDKTEKGDLEVIDAPRLTVVRDDVVDDFENMDDDSATETGAVGVDQFRHENR